MKEYSKPLIDVVREAAEGVYANSGTPGCQSQYMKGVWQVQYTGSWNGTEGMKYIFGCLGCQAYTGTGCGLASHYADSNYATSYERNIAEGRYKPAWEYNGKLPGDTVTSQDVHDQAHQVDKTE